MKNFLTSIIFSLLIVFGVSNFAKASETRFIDSNIWYSPSSFEEGETIDIHTAIWNGENAVVNAKVQFLDREVLLAEREVKLEPEKLQDISVSWKATAGDHLIRVNILSASKIINGKSTLLLIDEAEKIQDKLFVAKKVSEKETVPDADTNLVAPIKNLLDENIVDKYVPQVVAKPVNNTLKTTEAFRLQKYDVIKELKQGTQEHIKELESPEKQAEKKDEPLSGTEKPIAYVEVFLLSVVGFILKSSIVFYGLIIILTFLILRFIYRLIRR